VVIEQAIFTSAETDCAEGYQLVSRSSGLSPGDAHELALWGPSHDSLLERGGPPSSVNFFRLASGAYCVSRSTVAGVEYSGRGEVVYTQFLVVAPDTLARFANNPFAIVRAATAIGALRVLEKVPESLDALRLGGRSTAVDLALVAQLTRDPGPAAVATLVQTALASDRVAIASRVSADQLIAGLFSVLPIECRLEFSFSTGLKSSPSRPLRVSMLPSDRSSWRNLDSRGFTLLNLDDMDAAGKPCWEGWAGCVAAILNSGKLSVLAGQLDQPRPWLGCANLHLLSQQVEAALQSVAAAAVEAKAGNPPTTVATQDAIKGAVSSHGTRADAAHSPVPAVLALQQSLASRKVDQLADSLAAQPPEVLELLERVDDLVFAAIAGDDRALNELAVLWPAAAAELDADLVEQSREQYLRCALSIWSECIDGEVRRPERAVAAVDVLCVLFEE